MSPKSGIPLNDAMRVLHDERGDAVVVTAMSAAREWLTFPAHPLDFVYVPSSMGQASALALGLALAQPDRRIIAVNGDGSTLMNLGSLATITSLAPANLTLIVVANGVYDITGAQPTPAAAALRADRCNLDFADIAKDCGFPSVFRFDAVTTWHTQANTVLDRPGPTFVSLIVTAPSRPSRLRSPGPAPERARRFATSLQQKKVTVTKSGDIGRHR